MTTALDWLQEAKDDLAAAESLGQAKLYAAACFHCQQAAEKVLKAALIKLRGDFPKGHSLRQLAVSANLFGELMNELAVLEGDYTVSRYPDVYGKPPRSLYDSQIFAQRFAAARKVVQVVEKWIRN